MKINRILYYLVAMIFTLALQISCTGEKKPEKSRYEKAMEKKTLANATAKLNRSCPEMVDEDTRLDSVLLLESGHLSYNYTLINRDKASINELAFRTYLIPLILDNVHYNIDLKIHRDSSIIMDFNYWDRNGELITEITLGPENYR